MIQYAVLIGDWLPNQGSTISLLSSIGENKTFFASKHIALTNKKEMRLSNSSW